MSEQEIRSRRPRINRSTELAFERTRAAYERTMMSWIRTAASLITFGFSIYKFFQLETQGRVIRLNRLIGQLEFPDELEHDEVEIFVE